MTEESRAQLARLEERKRIAEVKKRTAAKKAAEEAQRKELAYVNSLPQLTGPSETVIVATSIDCARDLQNVVGLGKERHERGVPKENSGTDDARLRGVDSKGHTTGIRNQERSIRDVQSLQIWKRGRGALRERPLALRN